MMRDKHVRLLTVAIAALLLAAVFTVQGCASRNAGQAEPDGSAQQESATEPAEPAIPEEEPLYQSKVEVSGDEIAVITTPKGVIKFKFYPKDAPNHVASFIELAEKGFYSGTTFHRVEPGFVIQGGDPNTKTGDGPPGTGGPGYRLKAEFNDRKHLRGTVSMARSSDPDSAGSQFFICLAPAPFLDGQYTVFGEVTEGIEIIDKIEPGDPMESVEIVTGK